MTAIFPSDIDITTIADSTIKVNASLSGTHPCTFRYLSSSRTIIITPVTQFKPGDVVTVTITNKIKYTSGAALLGGFLWSFTIRVHQGSSRFTLKSTPSVGGNPWSVALADFNGDGSLDLATVGYNSIAVSILSNSGTGTFTVKSSQFDGLNPRSLTAADFNGDGIQDLAVSDYIMNAVWILANDGNGNLTKISAGHAELEPHEMAANDFNADGAMDVAAADFGDGYVSILQNDGRGNIALTWITTAGGSYSIVSGELTGDGYMDLALATGTSNAVSILRNNGLGNPEETQVFPVGTSPYAVVAADFNGDGALDLAAVNFLSNNVSILLNDGKGVFTVSSTLNAGSGPDAAAVGDFNGDGTIDLAVANAGSNSVSVYFNDGKGGFTLHSTAILAGSGNFAANCIKAGDLNGDGSIDLVVVGYNSDTLAVLLNQSNAPRAPVGLIAAAGNGLVQLHWNKNGESDILHYRIYCDTTTIADVCIDSTTATDTTKSIAGLKNNTTYYLRISAVDTAGLESDFSSEVSAGPDIGTGVARVSTANPFTYALFQNNPNPFNPSTLISYQLPTSGVVTLKVYDVLGREVRGLVDERQSAGMHTVVFDASDLSSGVYLYRIQSGNYIATKKLVLLK